MSNQGSARFGATVRSVLVSPGSAFVPALKRAETSAESRSTFLLAALGGAAALLLWLKIRALLGALTPPDFRWSFFVTWLVTAAVVAVVAQTAWSFAAPRLAGPDAGSPRSFRAVWALSAFPQIGVLLVLTPLDVLLVGRDAYTASDGGDSVALAWMALSTATSVSLAAWSAFVFAKGTHVAARATAARSAAVITLGFVSAGVAVAAVVGIFVAVKAIVG